MREEFKNKSLLILKRLEEKFLPQTSNIYNPFLFEKKGVFAGLRTQISDINRRIIQGYFGQDASLDRSRTMEDKAWQLINNTSTKRYEWNDTIKKKSEHEVKRIKEKELESLKARWQEIPKGGKEEEQWLCDALGFTTAYFEQFQKKHKKIIELWDNQLLYMSLMAINKGHFSFGELSTTNRALQLDTGEGKTITNGLIAAIKVLQGKEVFIVEQNYISAETNSAQLSPFFEDFLSIETGIVVDRKQGKGIVHDIKIDNSGLITERKMSGETLRKSFIFSNGERHEQEGLSGRQRSWKKTIVYCDHNSLGTDIAADRQFTTKIEDVLVPDLKSKVGLIQEADSLVIDEAANPFQIQIPISGTKAWESLSKILYKNAEVYLIGKKTVIKEPVHRTVKEKGDETKFTINLFYNVWASLYQIIKNTNILTDAWKKSESVITTKDQEFKYDDSVMRLILKNIVPPLSSLFEDDIAATKLFLKENLFIVETALQTLMTADPNKGFIAGEKPILMDQYGVPLDNRQRDVVHQVFLQLYNIWENEGLTKKAYDENEVLKVLKKTYRNLEIPHKIANRVIPSTLYREFGELKMTSGSMIPISQGIIDLYEAETITISRHQAIPESKTESNRLYTVCLDGGQAEVNFIEKNRIDSQIATLIKNIKLKKQAGLIIMPDAKSAADLNRLLATLMEVNEGITTEQFNKDQQIKIITGVEEYAKRGTLQETMSVVNPGDIIITTQIAHRDIDPKLNNELKKNGGLTTLVYLPPNERGLWQALQRSVRADIPGRRILLISDESIQDIKYQYYIDKVPIQPITAMLKSADEFDLEWQNTIDANYKAASNGDIRAQSFLLDQYIKFLRRSEGKINESLMFSMVKELPLENFRQRSLQYLQKDQNNLWENFVDLVTIYNLKYNYPAVKIPSETYNVFLDIKDENQRIQTLTKLGLYGDITYLQRKNLIRKMLMTSFWSDLLETSDFQYRDFMTQQLATDNQKYSYIQYEGAWRNYLENFLLTGLNFRLYLNQKIEDLDI